LSRFFKSAAFPILLVILLAFFVQNLFYGSNSKEEMTFNTYKAAVENAQVEQPVTVKTKDLVVTGKLKTGKPLRWASRRPITWRSSSWPTMSSLILISKRPPSGSLN
jgi:cell division protease FtsH